MIKTTTKLNGGSIILEDDSNNVLVDFTLSNKSSPIMCINCVISGNDSKSATLITASLLEKYNPVCLVIETKMRDLLYCRKMENVFRCSTIRDKSLFTILNNNKDVWSRLFSMTEEIDCGNLAKKSQTGIDFFSNSSIFAFVRKNTSPFEFLSIKEEYEYNNKELCTVKIREFFDIFDTNLVHLSNGEIKNSLTTLVESFKKNIRDERGVYYNSSGSFQKIFTDLVLPYILTIGESHDSSTNMIELFSKTFVDYITMTEDFLLRFGPILDSKQ